MKNSPSQMRRAGPRRITLSPQSTSWVPPGAAFEETALYPAVSHYPDKVHVGAVGKSILLRLDLGSPSLP